jgi:sugar phosphate isomerase/epimerase
MTTTRRNFLSVASYAAAALASPLRAFAQRNSPFKVAVLTDEISNDFDHACSVAARDFGMGWVELRNLWGKGVVDLKSDDVARAQAILTKYDLRVTDIASPLFKVDWPEAPLSKERSRGGRTLDPARAVANFKKQDDVLASSIEMARQFKTDKVRCFDFWKLDDQAPYRAAIDEKLQRAAETAKKQGVALVLENEPACNTATGPDAARVLAAVPGIFLNWDPGNAALVGETDVYPTGWNMLPKDRILHCHCKNVVADAGGKRGWSPVDVGYVDWTAQFRALKAAGYRNAVSLETHWSGGGTPEACSRISWAGMKKSLEAAQAL